MNDLAELLILMGGAWLGGLLFLGTLLLFRDENASSRVRYGGIAATGLLFVGCVSLIGKLYGAS